MDIKPDWSNTFNTEFSLYGHVSKALEAAAIAKYPFMAWNGRIYKLKKVYSNVMLRDVTDGEDTGILVADLK